MKTTPNLALPYPEPTDNTQTWNYWQNLAAKLDNGGIWGRGNISAVANIAGDSKFHRVPVSTLSQVGGVTLSANGELVVPGDGLYDVTVNIITNNSAVWGAYGLLNWDGVSQSPNVLLQANVRAQGHAHANLPVLLHRGDRVSLAAFSDTALQAWGADLCAEWRGQLPAGTLSSPVIGYSEGTY